jgi:branched-chain amino acid aminotransferase
MNSSQTLRIEKVSFPKPKPPVSDLGFGKYFSDHMLCINFTRGQGWHSPRVVPYEAFSMDPGASVLHYGQALFEGMKAFKQENGKIGLFRPEFNYQRMKDGADRLCMEMPPKEMFMEGLRALLKVDQDWIPTQQGCSLYIRPTLIGTESFLGVRPSDEFLFYVILSPVASYYKEGTSPVKIWVEQEYVRAAPGGLGATKAGANYAGSLKAAYNAKNKGYSQVLWLDVTHQYIEEVGTMNVFFVINDTVITPSLEGTILNGGTRECVLSLLKKWNYKLEERKLSFKEVQEAVKNKTLKEAFGTGTAAVISPIGELSTSSEQILINEGKTGPIAQKLYNELTGIQYGKIADTQNWVDVIDTF